MTDRTWNEKTHFSWDDLQEIVRILRSPEGCEWDRMQTHRSLRNNLLEEAYEVCEGIDRNDANLMCEELGDVLLQVVFHGEIARSEQAFSQNDIIDGICKKMIRRHPHVFCDASVAPDDLQKSWEELKRREKGDQSLRDTLSRVSKALPGTKRAEKFIEKGAVEPKKATSPLSAIGKEFYALCKRCVAENIDPEEAIHHYLNKIEENCTNCE